MGIEFKDCISWFDDVSGQHTNDTSDGRINFSRRAICNVLRDTTSACDWGKSGLGFTTLPGAKPSRPRPTVQHQVNRFSTPQVARSSSAECWGAARPPDWGVPRPGSWWAPLHCVWSSPMIFPMLWCAAWCRPVRAAGSTGDRSHPPTRSVWWPSQHRRLCPAPRTRRS